MRLRPLSLFVVVALAVSFATSCSRKQTALGSRDNPIRFYFMPFKGEEVFKQNAPLIEKYLESVTGLAIETIPVEDFVTIVKAFGQGKADIAFMNTLGYLLAADWAKVEGHLQYVYGDLSTSYRGEIIARADSGIRSASDLSGKSFAFVSPYSSSGYLYALKYLKDHQVKPSQVLFAGSHAEVVRMVYEGKVAAGTTFHESPSSDGSARDGRIELIKEKPDVLSVVNIVALTDEMPTGPITLRSSLSPEMKTKLVEALFNFSRTEEGRRVLFNLYNITGFQEVEDSDYDPVRTVIAKLGKTVQELVPDGTPYFRTEHIPGLE